MSHISSCSPGMRICDCPFWINCGEPDEIGMQIKRIRVGGLRGISFATDFDILGGKVGKEVGTGKIAACPVCCLALFFFFLPSWLASNNCLLILFCYCYCYCYYYHYYYSYNLPLVYRLYLPCIIIMMLLPVTCLPYFRLTG